MSDKIDDGGPAFPTLEMFEDVFCEEHGKSETTSVVSNSGMTLCDWFAGQALKRVEWFHSVKSREDIAGRCYDMADAMLAERTKREGGQ